MSRLPMLLSAGLLLSLSGCGPSPEEVCARAEAIANQEDAKPIPNCKSRMQMKKDTKPDEYQRLAPCIMDAKTVDDINVCLSTHQSK